MQKGFLILTNSTKQKSEKIKYVNAPLKWNTGLQNFEVDLDEVKKRAKKKF
ncbi:hypothetical protein J4233_05490 [Candidatus Pacearchaeota archaeon]|nr:hypothetical protein [uncultured archaeon]AQS28896.1 hypothetical protein [uncultured archaeon]MBS3077694.1 hypothetical protein [Candidatus Pacearchaeota archaeon]